MTTQRLQTVIDDLDKLQERLHNLTCSQLITMGLAPSAPEFVAYRATPCDMTYKLALRAVGVGKG